MSAHLSNPAPGQSRRRWIAATAGVVILGVISVAVWQFVFRASAPAPPEVSRPGLEPEVAEAIDEARSAVQRSPRSAAAWGKFGMVLRAHDFAAEANASFEVAERLDPADPRWPYLRALTLLLSDPAVAMPLLERAVDRCRTETAPRLRLAEELTTQGRLNDAEAHVRKVLSREPRNPRATLLAGQIAAQRGRLETARDFLEQSAATAPAVRVTHATLADVYERLGHRFQADQEQRIAASLSGETAWPDPFVEQVEALKVGAEAKVSYAGSLLWQGRGKEAIAVMEEFLQQNPDSPRAQLALGHYLIQLEQFAAAERPLREACRLAPDLTEAQFLYGVSLHQQKKYPEAMERYGKALELKLSHGYAHFNLGMCRKELGDRAGAMAALREAIRYKPDFAPSHRELGVMLAAEGRLDEAVRRLEQAVRIAPKDVDAQRRLDEARRQLADTKKKSN